jgi:peptidoglycan hydrolase CwlO-like protein
MVIYLGRWNEEVDMARKELKSTRVGLDEIQENINLLENSIAKDNARLEKLLRAEQVSFIIKVYMVLKNYNDQCHLCLHSLRT